MQNQQPQEEEEFQPLPFQPLPFQPLERQDGHAGKEDDDAYPHPPATSETDNTFPHPPATSETDNTFPFEQIDVEDVHRRMRDHLRDLFQSAAQSSQQYAK
jgi:hypothetical protein